MEQLIDFEYGEAGERSTGQPLVMPAPTIFPLLLAFGLMMIFGGVLFYPYCGYLGLLVTLASAIGWWRQVIPSETHELVPVNPNRRPSPISVDARAAVQLTAGDVKNRVTIPEEFHPYSSGVLGGLAGGAAMALLACVYGLISQHSIWFPINLLAGVVMPSMGDATLDQLRAFNGAALAAASVGHIGLSVLVGILYSVTLPMFPKYAPFWAGILMPLVWSGLIATLLNLVNPVLNGLINWLSFVACQLGFGLVCGYVIARSARIQTMQSWTFAERANMDAPGISGNRRENS